jgi:hypothetical protein
MNIHEYLEYLEYFFDTLFTMVGGPKSKKMQYKEGRSKQLIIHSEAEAKPDFIETILHTRLRHPE